MATALAQNKCYTDKKTHRLVYNKPVIAPTECYMEFIALKCGLETNTALGFALCCICLLTTLECYKFHIALCRCYNYYISLAEKVTE